MKSAAIASALFASLALAAPVHKRDYAIKYETVIETVVIYTTVWDAPPATEPAAAPSSSAALFFENPSPSPVEAVPSPSAPAPEPVVESPAASSAAPAPEVPTPEVSTSPLAPVPEAPTPTPEPVLPPAPVPEPSSAPAPAPKPSPKPAPEPVPEPPAAAEPKPSEQSSNGGGGGGGETYTGSLTMNYYQGGLGACGKPIDDGSMTVALAVAGFGLSTFDTKTGDPTNPWCGKKIRITYKGKTADATIMDRCPGCTGTGGLDATPALWEALTGGIGGASGDRLESGMSFEVIG